MKNQSSKFKHRVKIQLAMVFLVLGSSPIVEAQDTLWIWEYPSAANVSVTGHCNVSFLADRHTYRCSLESAPTSEQSVEGFFADHNSTIDSVGSPNLWRGGPQEGDVVMWHARRAEVRIPPNGELQGFAMSSHGMPSIFQLYVRGYRYIPPFDEITPDSTIGGDVFENSLKGLTVAPQDPPTPSPPLPSSTRSNPT